MDARSRELQDLMARKIAVAERLARAARVAGEAGDWPLWLDLRDRAVRAKAAADLAAAEFEAIGEATHAAP